MSALAPPYRGFEQVCASDDRDPPPPGSIILGTSSSSIIATLAELTLVVTRWPWVIPCVALPAGDEIIDGSLMIVAELRDRLVAAKGLPSSEAQRIAKLLGAVRRRGAPSATVLARWISRRLGLAELEPLLLAQFREALEGVAATGSASVSTFCRYFARLGLYTARDWRALARFCAQASVAGPTGDDAHVRLSSRIVGEYAKKYLGVPARNLEGRVGWEWVAEIALRAAGYV